MIKEMLAVALIVIGTLAVFALIGLAIYNSEWKEEQKNDKKDRDNK
jgi:type II secretory pathway pseudopilin PulG